MSKKKTKNYISNKELYEHMIKYKASLEYSIINNTSKPKVSDYIGQAIVLICENLAKKPNFVGYTSQWKQEMISDGMVDCIAAVDNFDPSKTTNPFAYFTQIAWNAFIRRIFKEKKQTYIKYKNLQNEYFLYDLESDESIQQTKHNDNIDDFIKSFEKSLTKIKKIDKVEINGE